MVLLPGPKSLRLKIFLKGFWFCFVIRVGLLLRYWLEFCPFGLVLPGLLVGVPNWKLPDKGHVCELVTDGVVDDRVIGSDGVCRVSFPGSAGGTGVLCDGRVLGRL